MRYGKSAGRLDINPTARRSPGQGLKKAAPGAPFGWCSSGTPYIGTQYAVKGTGSAMQFASLSTRNGAEQFYWKKLSGLSSKVALSALETHGTVGCLLAGESGLPIKDILEVAQVAHVRAVFARLLGEEVLRRFEATGEANEAEAAPSADADGSEAAPSAEAEAAGTASALRSAVARIVAAGDLNVLTSRMVRRQLEEEGHDASDKHAVNKMISDAMAPKDVPASAAGPAKASSTTSGTQQQESAVGPKRKARMMIVDELRAEDEKKPKKSKSGGDALILD